MSATNADKKTLLDDAEVSINLAKDSADIVLAPEGNLVQSLLVEESALAASAQFKDTLKELVDGPKRFRNSIPLGMGSFLPPLPFEDAVVPFIEKTDKEIKAQELAEKLASLVGSSVAASTNSFVDSLHDMEPEHAALVLKELRENFPEYEPRLRQLGGKFLSTLLSTASSNLETTLSDLERSGAATNAGFRATVKGLSTVAQRSASVLSPSPDDSPEESHQTP